MKGLSAICDAGKEVTAEAKRRRSRISFDRDVFCVMSASALIHIWLKVACFRFHVPFVPDCFVWPLGCFAVSYRTKQIIYFLQCSVALRARGRLHCHVSGRVIPFGQFCHLWKEGWLLMISASSLIISRHAWVRVFLVLNLMEVPCSCCVLEPGGLNRFDHCDASGVRAFDAFTA